MNNPYNRTHNMDVLEEEKKDKCQEGYFSPQNIFMRLLYDDNKFDMIDIPSMAFYFDMTLRFSTLVSLRDSWKNVFQNKSLKHIQ